MSDFIKNRTLEEQTDSIGAFTPGGRLFAAKNYLVSKLRCFFRGFAQEILRVGNKINEIMIQHDINNTVDFLPEWERALGIPDHCFTQTVGLPIEDRRRQIRAKIFMRRTFTEQDYYDLAEILVPGIPINIEHRPAYPFRMYVHLPRALEPNLFPLPFPIQFGGKIGHIIECVFDTCKPATSRYIYVYDL